MSKNNKYRKPVLKSTEEFATSLGTFQRIITLYRRKLVVVGNIILKDESLLNDILFIHALRAKIGQDILKGYIDFKETKVSFEVNIAVWDEEDRRLNFCDMNSRLVDRIFDELLKSPKLCNLQINDYGRDHYYRLDDKEFEHLADIEEYIGKEKKELLKSEVFQLADAFDSYNY